jgi:hypothetical protein
MASIFRSKEEAMQESNSSRRQAGLNLTLASVGFLFGFLKSSIY